MSNDRVLTSPLMTSTRQILPLALVVAAAWMSTGCAQWDMIRDGIEGLTGRRQEQPADPRPVDPPVADPEPATPDRAASSGSDSLFYRASETVTGSLSPTDRINPLDNSYIDDYPLTVETGDILVAALISNDFDAYLELRDSSDELVASDDDSGPDVNAFLAARFTSAGQYNLEASSFAGEETGSYTLGYTLGPVEWQETFDGELTSSSARHPGDDSFMDEYALEARGGRALLVSMTSRDVDAFLQVLDPQGEVIASNDDSGGGTDALLVVYLSDAGEYTIRANTFGPGETGRYRLQYRLL